MKPVIVRVSMDPRANRDMLGVVHLLVRSLKTLHLVLDLTFVSRPIVARAEASLCMETSSSLAAVVTALGGGGGAGTTGVTPANVVSSKRIHARILGQRQQWETQEIGTKQDVLMLYVTAGEGHGSVTGRRTSTKTVKDEWNQRYLFRSWSCE